MSSDESTIIDIGSWLSTLARNWWVIVGLIVLGAVVGGIVTLAQPKQYSATASVYIGQTTDAQGNAMAGLSSNAKAAVQLLASQVVLSDAAERTGMGMTSAKLRRETSVVTPSSTVKTSTSVVNIVVITVTDTKKARAAAAANNLADVLVERLSGDSAKKVQLLEQQLAEGKSKVAASVARAAAAEKAMATIARGGASAAERAVAVAPYLAIVQAVAVEQEAWITNNSQTERLLLVAKSVEEPRLLHKAAAPDSPSGPSLTLNVAAGALAGLVIGVIVAFVRRRLSENRTATA